MAHIAIGAGEAGRQARTMGTLREVAHFRSVVAKISVPLSAEDTLNFKFIVPRKLREARPNI